MPTVKCRCCSKEFYSKPSWIRKGFGKFCSALCHHESQKNGEIVNCFICKKKTYKTLKALKSSKSRKYFCGKSCQAKWRNTEFIGEKHANWTTGEYAYRSILRRHKIVQVCTLCRTKDVRVLAVHHIDENHYNNDVQNLTWLCHNCHFLVHHDNLEKQKLLSKLKN